MKVTVVSIRVSVLLLLLLQSIPIKAMNAGMAFALPEAKAGAAYEYTIRTEGGQPPLKWSVAEGKLPPGIELEQSGRLRGTPSSPRPQAYEFTLQVSDSSEPPRTHTQRFALVVTPAPLRMVLNQTNAQLSLASNGNDHQKGPSFSLDTWKNKYVKRSQEITQLKAETKNAGLDSTAAKSDQAKSKDQMEIPGSSLVSEFNENSFARARGQHKVEEDFVSEFVKPYVTVLDPKSVSDSFGRRIAKRYVTFQVTVSNENKDYQFLIQDVSIDLSDVADLESVRIPTRYTPSSNDLSMLRGVSEKGQVYDWRNMVFRLLRGTGTVAAGLPGVIEVGKAFAPGVATFNGPLTSSFRDVLPDLTVTQVHRLNDSAYQSNTLVPKQGAKVMVAFVDQAMLMDRELQKRFWKDPMSIVDLIDFRKAKARVKGMLITDVLDQPPFINTIEIDLAQRQHFSEKPVEVEGRVIGKNLTGASIQIESGSTNTRLPASLKVERKGAPESNELAFTITSDEPIPRDVVLNFVVVKKNDVAKYPFQVSYTIPVPALDDVSPKTIKQGDPETEFTLTGTGFIPGLSHVTGCEEKIEIKQDAKGVTPTEIRIRVQLHPDAAKGECALQVKNGDGDKFASNPQNLTIEKAKDKQKEKPQED